MENEKVFLSGTKIRVPLISNNFSVSFEHSRLDKDVAELLTHQLISFIQPGFFGAVNRFNIKGDTVATDGGYIYINKPSDDPDTQILIPTKNEVFAVFEVDMQNILFEKLLSIDHNIDVTLVTCTGNDDWSSITYYPNLKISTIDLTPLDYANNKTVQAHVKFTINYLPTIKFRKGPTE